MLGVVEWFDVGEEVRVERVVRDLRALGIRHLRTGISWANWYTDGAEEWFDWLLPRLARDFEVLPCVTYTPPSLGMAPRSSSPPRRARDYADVLDVLITRYGDCFSHLELWNEPNARSSWDYTLDPQWHTFTAMLGDAAHWVHQRGKKTVLGGLSPIDPGWLDMLGHRNVLPHLDVIGIHGSPDRRDADWDGWSANVTRVQDVLDRHDSAAAIWITQGGFSTWQGDEGGQIRALLDVLEAPVPRIYWHAAEDLAAERVAAERPPEDERQLHFGLRHSNGRPKLLARLWAEGGIAAVREVARQSEPTPRRRRRARHALVTGGAGFVGTNLAHRLLSEGKRVVVLDNLSRPGVEANLRWLCDRHGDRVTVQLDDVRNRFAVREALARADQVYHLAAQVAVTGSLADPLHDFRVNLEGTVTLLEELRRLPAPPFTLFTSTNKVYGALDDLPLARRDDRWEPVDRRVRLSGLDEKRPLDFCTPYGCSKGAADQYVLDYAKSYGLPAVVFRMSCIYGPHQHGNEDQGWVAHFLIRMLEDDSITLYGDGAQVRDILFVDDLVRAILAARDGVGSSGGRAFNIGGGPANAVSLLQILEFAGELVGEPPIVDFAPERAGDQRYYVANTARLAAALDWAPSIDWRTGVERLYGWLESTRGRTEHSLQAVAR